MDKTRREQDPLWYKDAVIYELSVRAFSDSDEDGIGDFPGLTSRLDYLEDLGVTAVWLQPFSPSPMRDDGYDISDYRAVDPAYGTLDDFRAFLDAAHARGLRVIADVVMNHTSDRHPWFQNARRAPPGSREREFYVWSDTSDRYAEARVIFPDSETSNWAWDPVARAYYWHRFYAHEPDLNYDSPDVQAAMLQVVDFWLELGVDGLGLAAVPYLFEREGTTGENLPETHAFLKQLRAHVDERFGDRPLLAQADAWPEDAAPYLDGDECQMAVNFPIMPRLFMAVRQEDRFPVIDILRQTPPVPATSQWVVFLRNHDELTLQMVTDEERDYMYRVYAYDPQARIHRGIRHRLAPLLGNDRRKIELMKGLLFSLIGTPVIYYGDEIGMGDNIYLGDREAVRMPMQWNADRNAGFSRANPQRLYLPVNIHPQYHFEAVNVETQYATPSSLLWWTKNLIALRKRFSALSRGDLEFLSSDNRKVLAFIRRCPPGVPKEQDETILVVANLSRFAEHVRLDLAEFEGRVPVEVMGRRRFPEVGSEPYVVMLAPYAFYWFALKPQRAEEDAAAAAPGEELPVLAVPGHWADVLQSPARAGLEAILPAYLKARRWFRGKARPIRLVEVVDAIPVPFEGGEAYVMPVRVDYEAGDDEVYVLPVAFAAGEREAAIRAGVPQAAIARLDGGTPGLLYAALWDPDFGAALLQAIADGRDFAGTAGTLAAERTTAFARVRGTPDAPLRPKLGRAEQSNTSMAFDGRLILKVFRRIEEGINPDLEVTRFLTEHAAFAHIPPVAGSLEYRPARGAAGRRVEPEPMTLGILQGYVPNEGDAWDFTLDALGRYVDRVRATSAVAPQVQVSTPAMLDLARAEPPDLAREMIGTYLDSARLLARRTAEMHVALASDPDNPSFAPEPFDVLYQRSLYQSMRAQADQVFDLSRHRLSSLPESIRAEARELLDLEGTILDRFRSIAGRKIRAARIRTHGDYHLGQVLYTGDDFVIIDFEGEPGRPMSERRYKRSALRDVAGMLRSFQYAAYGKMLFDLGAAAPRQGGQVASLDAWARFWQLWVCASFMQEYLAVARGRPFLPEGRDELQILLDAYLLEKAVYELGYELNNRPDWVTIPIRSLRQFLRSGGNQASGA